MSATIIYYSSNDESPEFEGKITDVLSENCGGLPIISVTQKPMSVGKNICVGEVGASGFNMFRQILIGCEEADTDFIISAESDAIYPPDYFTYRPGDLNTCHRSSDLYTISLYRHYFFCKPWGSTLAQVIGREFYIKRLKELLPDDTQWSVKEKNFPKERHRISDIFPVSDVHFFQTGNPIVTFKTGRGMRHYTTTQRQEIYEIPYWGAAEGIYGKYLE